MNNITISNINSTSPRYNEVFMLRDEILRKPLGMSLYDEDMSRDAINTIFIAEHEGKIIGCVLMEPKDTQTVQLRAMAVYNDWQRKGIGRLLVQALEAYAWQNGYSKIILHARKVVLGFYKSMDYQQIGDEFKEVGIPHYHMEKSN
jgi:N-acetylglutamate synthase-like GNAT family acetyltransferase